MLVSHESKISLINEWGKISCLPVSFYLRQVRHGSKYLDAYTGEPVEITDVGNAELVSISTNYSPAVSDHHIAYIDPSAKLLAWNDSSVVVAGKIKRGEQLMGEAGMYVVEKVSRIVVPAIRVCVVVGDGLFTDWFKNKDERIKWLWRFK